MKTLLIAAALFFAALNPVAYADEASQKAVAEELLQIMKVNQMTKPLFSHARTVMEQEFARMGAKEDMKPILKRYVDKVLAVMEHDLGWQALKNDMITIYARSFTEDELKSMLAFYKSPVGQSVIDKLPAAMKMSMEYVQKRMPAMQEKFRKVAEEFAAEIKAEMQKKKQESETRKAAPSA